MKAEASTVSHRNPIASAFTPLILYTVVSAAASTSATPSAAETTV